FEAIYESAKPCRKKRSHDDQDPLKNHEGKSMKRRKGAGQSSSKKGKATADLTHFESFADVDEPRQEQEEDHHDEFSGRMIIGLTFRFAKQMKSFLNKDEITKADPKGPAFELLKNRFKNSVELERIVIKKRVEDAQLGVESYQTKLNLTEAWFNSKGLHLKVSYTTMSHPKGVLYLRKHKKKMLMRANEIHKFNDRMLNKVYNKLDVIL
nr:hypothetical protein [Tanacetum cinerariifolium]